MPNELSQDLEGAVQQAIVQLQSGVGRQFSDLDQTMFGLIRRWGEAKFTRLDIINQNGANLVYNHGKHTANLLGLTAEEKEGVVPFPGSSSTSVVVLNPAPQSPPRLTPVTATPVPADGGTASGIGGLAKRLLAPVLVAGAVGTGASAAYNALTDPGKPETPPAIEQPVIPPPPAKEAAVGLEVR
jgi:hypothetical protein